MEPRRGGILEGRGGVEQTPRQGDELEELRSTAIAEGDDEEEQTSTPQKTEKRRKKKKRSNSGSKAAGEDGGPKSPHERPPLVRERSSFFPTNEGEGADVLLLNKDELISDRLDRKLRNLNQLRRSSVVSGMKELWMEDLPHPQRSLGAAAAGWGTREMPTGYGGGGEEIREELEKELYQCLSAKTALILPFHWGDNNKSITQWIDRLLKRTIIDKDTGRRVRLWESDFMLPFEVSELSAHFRQIVGWNETVKRFLHEQHMSSGGAAATAGSPHADSVRDFSQTVHQHSEFTPRPDDLLKDRSREQRDERRKERMHRRMNKQMTTKMAGGAGTSGADSRGRPSERGESDHESRSATDEDDDESRDGPNRNCLLMDEGGDIEAEQEEEEVDSIANDLEVWKCQRMKLTRKAREMLFPNPCIWASSGDAVPSPVQARDEERRRHMAEQASSSDEEEDDDQKKEEGDRTQPQAEQADSESGIPRIPPPPAQSRARIPLHSISTPNLGTQSEPAVRSPPAERKVSVPSLPSSWEDYAITGSGVPAGAVPPEIPQGATVLSNCDNKIGFEVEMDSVELVMYPLGCGLLVFHLNWMPEKLKDVPLTLDELRTWLFLVKFRHKVKKVFLGWTLGMEAALIAHGLSEGLDKKKTHDMGPFLNSHLRSLGRLGNSIYGDELLSLCTIGNWLLQLPHEDPTAPLRRISYGACANHHTTVVLDREPDEPDLKEYLFHLTRAFGQRNRPPPPGVAERQRLDHVLVHRLNRYIGISREGTVAMSWPTDAANRHFEAHTWPKLFQGVYLILCLHARGEASVLSELSNLSASAAEHLRLESLMEGETLEKLEKDRTYLRYLAVLLIKYSLGMSSDDCGGLSEYSHFFSTMRRVLRIPETRQEIREEIHDVLGIVEGGYLEEQRRQIQEEKRTQRKKERDRYKTDREKDAQKRRMEILLSIIGAITLPLVLVSGIWGMNIHDLPDLSFWPLLGVTSGSSLIFLAILLGWLFFLSPPRPATGARQRERTSGNGGSYTSLATSGTTPNSPRASLETERTLSSIGVRGLESGTPSERSLASAFAALTSRGGSASANRLRAQDLMIAGVGSPAPPRSRVSFNLSREQSKINSTSSDLYANP